MWDKRAEYLSNADGNTVKLVLDQGFGDTKLVTLRLLGIRAPEISDPGGPECQAFVEEWFNERTFDKSPRWNFIATTSQIDEDRYAAVISDVDNQRTLNSALADFIHENGYTVKKNA